MQTENLLARFTDMSRALFSDNLTGVYLHGSIAMGCYHPENSDIDLILIVKDEISEETRVQFIKNVVLLNKEAPKKGIELSVVRQKYIKPFVYPTPYEIHFSNAFLSSCISDPLAHVRTIVGTDKDLAAHFTILYEYGVPLFGPSVREIFAKVPKADYFDSIYSDIENAQEDILKDPVYITLNLCRVLAFAKEEKILSKMTGGEWGMQSLPAIYKAQIENALKAYSGKGSFTPDENASVRYANYMKEEILKYSFLL